MKYEFTPCWILSSPRTGSTYLCDLLNSTGLFGNNGTSDPVTGEVDRWTEYYCAKFFKNSYIVNPPKINKIHYCQYENFFGNYDVSNILPKMKYVLLRRKDICAVAVSKYFVTEGAPFMDNKERWNIHNEEEVKIMQNMKLKFNKQKMIMNYNKSKKEYFEWDNFLKDKQFIEIEYEKLVEDPIGSTKKVLNYMGLEGSPYILDVKNPIKLDHPQKNNFCQYLKD